MALEPLHKFLNNIIAFIEYCEEKCIGKTTVTIPYHHILIKITPVAKSVYTQLLLTRLEQLEGSVRETTSTTSFVEVTGDYDSKKEIAVFAVGPFLASPKVPATYRKIPENYNRERVRAFIYELERLCNPTKFDHTVERLLQYTRKK